MTWWRSQTRVQNKRSTKLSRRGRRTRKKGNKEEEKLRNTTSSTRSLVPHENPCSLTTKLPLTRSPAYSTSSYTHSFARIVVMRAVLWEIKPKTIQRSKISLICALPIIIFIIFIIFNFFFFPCIAPDLLGVVASSSSSKKHCSTPFQPTYLPIHPTTKTPIWENKTNQFFYRLSKDGI